MLIACAEFQADVVLLMLGLDSLKSDRVKAMALIPTDYRDLVIQIGVALPGARIIVILECGDGKAMSSETSSSIHNDMADAILKIQVRIAIFTADEAEKFTHTVTSSEANHCRIYKRSYRYPSC